jgi:alpha-N-arabinofuranosidase
VFDNNLLLSSLSLTDNSQGGAYAHNLFAGAIDVLPFDDRQTPFLKAHSTAVAGYHTNPRGDDRFYNNLFVQHGDLTQYNDAPLPVWMDGNVFLKGAKPSAHEKHPVVEPKFDPGIRLAVKANAAELTIKLDRAWTGERTRKLVTTSLLGRATIPDLPYEQPDGTPLQIDTDYFGRSRSKSHPTPGPFEDPRQGVLALKVW